MVPILKTKTKQTNKKMTQQSREGSVQNHMETHYFVPKLKINDLCFQEDLIGSYFN